MQSRNRLQAGSDIWNETIIRESRKTERKRQTEGKSEKYKGKNETKLGKRRGTSEAKKKN